jgi:adenylate cyclase
MAYALPDQPSIAVLPFTNMSDDPKQEFFSDGITEEIITALSKLPQFFVIARNSTFTYKGKAVKIKQVSEELGVQYVLEGSVRRDGDRVRITAQLIDGLSGKHLWAERYEGELKDIFALQDQITMKIITELRGKMVIGGETRSASKGTKNMDAYLKYLQATEFITRLTKEDAIQARKLYDEVIALDPEYPRGYARLALLLALDAVMGRTDSSQKANAQAMEIIAKAISIDPEEGHFYALRGVVHAQMRQYDEALADAAKALSLEPNHPGVLNESASVLWRSGKPEQALPLFDRLFRLSPVPVIGNFTGACMAYNLAGQYEKAAEMFKKAIQKYPQVYLGHLGYAISAALLGRTEEASGAVKELLRVNPRFSIEQFKEFQARVGVRDQSAVEKFSEALRKAGLPETAPKG